MTAAGHRETLDVTSMLEEAHRQAREAAARAGVDVRLVTEVAALEAVEALINETWRNPSGEISLGMLRALSKSGNLVSGAYQGGTLLGACVAFISGGDQPHLHSHLAAVRPRERTRGIGFALKLHQRAWTLDRGITTVSWTFDPLVRRNARLNLVRLGADPVEYLPDFYGTREDAFNASLPTDRLLVSWRLDSHRTRDACARATAPMATQALLGDGGRIVLECGDDDEPVSVPDLGAPIVLVGLPQDIASLRQTRPGVAELWRASVRETVGRALDQGLGVVGFTEQGHYVIRRPTADHAATNGVGR